MVAVSTTSRVRRALPTLIPLVIGVLLAGLLLSGARDRARLSADARLRASVATAVTQVGSAMRGQLTQAAQATSPGGTRVAADAIGRSSVALDTFVEARDTGTPMLDDDSRPASVVVPLYASGQVPPTTELRRLAVTGYHVVPLTIQPSLVDLAPDGGGLVVRGPSHVVAAQPRSPVSGARTYATALDLGSTTGWTLQGWLPAAGPPASTWLWLVLLLGLFGALSVVVATYQRKNRAAEARQEQLERDAALVSGLAPVVQASLDLGEVIPAVSSHLAQGLDLAGLSLSSPTSTGERQLFAWGVPPDSHVPPVARPPESLEPGETFAVSLARGGRALGVLRIVAGEPLGHSDLRALATASELLGSTLANAEAFSQQQDVVQRMRSVDELKTVFLATASHELRTPVTAIVGFSTLVLESWGEGDPEVSRGFLERVVTNARALETLTEQLLDFSRLERGIKPSAGDVLDLGRTTGEILSDHPELTASHHLELDLARGALMIGSQSAVARIVTNLVSNAAKYSPEGTTITVTTRTTGNRVELLVDDEGPGVPAADRERVFSRFYRGRGTEVSRTRGAGVGLAIVAEFAASMSGEATVEQAPSGGARFCVSFPTAEALSREEHEGATHVRLA